ncbi:ubiquinone/menaquinone biosynthesis C-methylase UbiE/DNA-binding transcriptional MerR regulator [Paenibacillus endophyticus]|uniref:Ubiquinone/menaquinone biosynthesis C-methylase UbiE/DNA-binding transcriptional MerR regulator n=1 Tax=Paenibacillus endophyticus TaxID=1294268 RepID=A0A7W5C9W8_9BACL|nr:methyltransferase domain-containing protein [Paenibacillus endophyticus]MBB3153841.1 ubiquinone/menaquinone biosynthesis C-methylase UbiE/DNA-binding transcriptional MerR regulator [Paenibacillus endophyticus]
MKRRDKEYLTTGQIAKRTGMTIRTLRYYDQIGLLKPSQYNHASVRLYSKEDLVRLQKIHTLKYIGLTLADIKQIIYEGSLPEQDLKNSLMVQKEVIRQKIVHMQYVSKAIDEALDLLREHPTETDWDSLSDIIQTIHTEKNWGEQYRNALRLQARIRLYDRFSANKIGWHRWFFDQLGSASDLKILELGCGDAALWSRNIDRVPPSWSITLIDISPGMLEAARTNVNDQRNQFAFLMADAQAIPFQDSEFDVIIANHMLYHVLDIGQALSECHRVLKHDGQLYTSTMSKSHLQEMEQLARAFDPDMRVLDNVMERFHFDNGANILASQFTDMELIRYEDCMQVDEAEPLIQYMTSTPMNARFYLTGDKLEAFRSYLNEKIQEGNGSIYITMDSGFFLSRKRS